MYDNLELQKINVRFDCVPVSSSALLTVSYNDVIDWSDTLSS